MEENELTILRTQAAQCKSEMEGCPGGCFAARFLRDYGKMFDLFEKSEKRYKKLEARYKELDTYAVKLEMDRKNINGEKHWRATVDENNESR